MIPRHKFPGWYDQKRKFHVAKQVKSLIRSHPEARITKFRDLPVGGHLALVQYMAIDGEAWSAPGLEDAIEQHLKIYSISPGRRRPEATRAWGETLRGFLPLFVERYGGLDFGFIPNLSMRAAIESVMADIDFKDYGSWTEYHAWYMTRRPQIKHQAPDPEPWAVILSSFEDEVFQDGWTRFHNYAERGLETIPAVWYPHQQSREGARVYRATQDHRD